MQDPSSTPQKANNPAASHENSCSELPQGLHKGESSTFQTFWRSCRILKRFVDKFGFKNPEQQVQALRQVQNLYFQATAQILKNCQDPNPVDGDINNSLGLG